MKVAILTYHYAMNYGAEFQTYALQEYLNSLPEIDAYVLDYRGIRPMDLSLFFRPRSIVKHPIASYKEYPVIKELFGKFVQFRSRYFNIQDKDVKRKDLKSISDKYDLFIVGSDQVWNPILNYFDQSYLLDFVDDAKKKASYAASIGDTQPSDRIKKYFGSYLKDFSHISVREQDAIAVLSNYCDMNQTYVCVDPVFLQRKEFWDQLAGERRLIKQKYVLYFSLNMKTPGAYRWAQELARHYGYELIYVTDYERNTDCPEATHFGTASPIDMLNLIRNAEYVVTNSFHGTAMSIIFHRRFFVETQIPRANRINGLLSFTDLDCCKLVNGCPQEQVSVVNRIDWCRVDETLEEYARNSKQYIADLIS